MFFKKEESCITLHYAASMKDKVGSGKDLIHYSHISLKDDILRWLRENGRLPSTTTAEYFEEISRLNQLEQENKALKNKTLPLSQQDGLCQHSIEG